MIRLIGNKNVIASAAARFVVAAIAVLMFSFSLRAQENPHIYFQVGKYALRNIETVNRALARIDSMITANGEFKVDSILVVSKASPEAPVSLNNRLAKRRAEVVRDYIVSHYPHLASRISLQPIGEAWESFRDMVVEDGSLSSSARDKILEVIDSDLPLDRKEARLKTLPEYRHLLRDLFPDLRVSIVYGSGTIDLDLSYLDDILAEDLPPVETDPFRMADTPIMALPLTLPPRAIIAIKSNLLYDLAATPNIGIEIPFGKGRVSAGFNYEFPWWVFSHNSRAWEILHVEPFVRYWFGDRNSRPALTGLYLGAVGGVGYYDIEPHHKGWQGEAVNAGLELGYAWAFGKNKHWRFETGIGAGWMRTQYSYYKGDADDDHLLWQRDGLYDWIGPIKLNASISYVIFHKYLKKK